MATHLRIPSALFEDHANRYGAFAVAARDGSTFWTLRRRPHYTKKLFYNKTLSTLLRYLVYIKGVQKKKKKIYNKTRDI